MTDTESDGAAAHFEDRMVKRREIDRLRARVAELRALLLEWSTPPMLPLDEDGKPTLEDPLQKRMDLHRRTRAALGEGGA